jgi:hypothetical protein
MIQNLKTMPVKGEKLAVGAVQKTVKKKVYHPSPLQKCVKKPRD